MERGRVETLRKKDGPSMMKSKSGYFFPRSPSWMFFLTHSIVIESSSPPVKPSVVENSESAKVKVSSASSSKYEQNLSPEIPVQVARAYWFSP